MSLRVQTFNLFSQHGLELKTENKKETNQPWDPGNLRRNKLTFVENADFEFQPLKRPTFQQCLTLGKEFRH